MFEIFTLVIPFKNDSHNGRKNGEQGNPEKMAEKKP